MTDPVPVQSDAVARGVLLSTGTQLAAKVVHLALNVVSSLALIHHLGPGGYGDYVLVVTVAGMAGLVGDFGLNKLAVRQIAVDRENELSVVGSLLTARLLLGCCSVALTQAVLVVLQAPGDVHVAGFVLSMMALTEAALGVLVVFQVRLQQQYEALLRVAAEALETAIVLLLIMSGAGIVALVAAPVVAATAGVVLAMLIVRRRLGAVPRPSTSRVRKLLREALPVGPALLIAASYLRIAGLLLAAFSSAAEVGLYGAAYQPVEYLLLAAAVLVNVLLPLLARAYVVDHDRFVMLYRRGTEALLGVTAPIVVAIVVLAPWLVSTAYGDDYRGAATPMRILAVALVAMVVSFWQSYVLLAGGQQRVTLIYDAVALVATVALCVVLVPDLGGTGAAIAICSSAVLVAGWATAATRRRLRATLDARRVACIIGSAVSMAIAAAFVSTVGFPTGIAVLLGTVVYVVTMVSAGVVVPDVLIASLRSGLATRTTGAARTTGSDGLA